MLDFPGDAHAGHDGDAHTHLHEALDAFDGGHFHGHVEGAAMAREEFDYLASEGRFDDVGDEIFLAGSASFYKTIQLQNPIYEKLRGNNEEQIHTKGPAGSGTGRVSVTRLRLESSSNGRRWCRKNGQLFPAIRRRVARSGGIGDHPDTRAERAALGFWPARATRCPRLYVRA